MTVLLQRYNHHVRPPKLASACSSRRYFRESYRRIRLFIPTSLRTDLDHVGTIRLVG
jgi:hypothetical protein